MKTVFKSGMVILCLFGLGLSSCSDEPYSTPLGKLRWIEGEWKGRVKGGMMYEEWKLGVDSALIGTSRTLVLGETVFSETMQITKNDEGQLQYIVKVAHNDSAVTFTLIEQTSKGYFFENLSHDFPTRIVYANTLGDMMLVRIEGERNGRGDTARFFMHRIDLFPPEEEEEDGFMQAF